MSALLHILLFFVDIVQPKTWCTTDLQTKKLMLEHAVRIAPSETYLGELLAGDLRL